jgi:NADH-quinone oxidoreductase subunit C
MRHITPFAVDPEALSAHIESTLGALAETIDLKLGEITVVVAPANYLQAATLLRDAPGCRFEQLLDLCGVDYSEHGEGSWEGQRYCAVSHLLSVSLNQRVRLKVFAADDDLPVVDSVTGIWSSANWFEREAFDLYGIIGHPFRKDFPVSGHVEMRYDPERQRVIYQPVTIEPREVTPRIIREENYGGIRAPGK